MTGYVYLSILLMRDLVETERSGQRNSAQRGKKKHSSREQLPSMKKKKIEQWEKRIPNFQENLGTWEDNFRLNQNRKFSVTSD